MVPAPSPAASLAVPSRASAEPPPAAPAPGEHVAAQVLEVRGAWVLVDVPAIAETRWVNLETGVVLEPLEGDGA